MSTAQEGGRLSAVLQVALHAAADGVTVGEIADRVADRGYGLLLVLLGLPTLIPVLPPGASAVVGLLCTLIGVQMLMILPRPWLPGRIRRRHLSPKSLKMLATRGIGLLERLEKMSRPRWQFILQPFPLRMVAAVLIAIGVVLFLPMPFMNTIPGMGILLIGLGLLNRDGAFVLIGTALCLVLIVVVVLFGHVLAELLIWAKDLLRAQA